jgi:hypothetical protein
MTRELAFFCRNCYSYASPDCQCGSVHLEKLYSEEDSSSIFLLYTEDIDTVETYYVWTNEDGQVLYRVEGPPLEKGLAQSIFLDEEEIKRSLSA